MVYSKSVIDIAENQVGYLEKKSNKDLDSKTANAGYNNWTKYGRDLVNWIGSPFANNCPWCQMWVVWCFVIAFTKDKAKKMLGGWTAYTPTAVQYYKNNNRWYTKNPKIGDQIFFKNSSGTVCHTGLVYKVDGSYVYTIEGNTSSNEGVVANGGGVFRKKYSLSYSRIAGYGRPPYDGYCYQGWMQTDGKWWYQYSDGSSPKDGWKQIDNNWYYFDKNGWLLTKQFIKSANYNSNGALYWVDDDGAWNYKTYRWMQDAKGWYLKEVDGSWYPTNEWELVDNKWYYFDSEGYMVTGNYTIDGKTYSFRDDGSLIE